MNLIASNLLELLKTFKSAREMARFLDISYTTLHQYLKGRVPPADFIILVCERFGVNYEWLLTGKGEMFRADEEILLDLKLMEEVIDMAVRVFRSRKVELKSDKIAEIIITLYKIAAVTEKELTEEQINKFVKMA